MDSLVFDQCVYIIVRCSRFFVDLLLILGLFLWTSFRFTTWGFLRRTWREVLNIIFQFLFGETYWREKSRPQSRQKFRHWYIRHFVAQFIGGSFIIHRTLSARCDYNFIDSIFRWLYSQKCYKSILFCPNECLEFSPYFYILQYDRFLKLYKLLCGIRTKFNKLLASEIDAKALMLV